MHVCVPSWLMLLLSFVVTDGTDIEEKQSAPRVGGSDAGGD